MTKTNLLRTLTVMRYMWATSRARQRGYAIGVACMCALGLFYCLAVFSTNPAADMASLCGGVFQIVLLLQFSDVFADLHAKSSCTAFLTLPAQPAEKFWGRIAFHALVALALTVAMTIVCEIGVVAACLMHGAEWGSVTIAMFTPAPVPDIPAKAEGTALLTEILGFAQGTGHWLCNLASTAFVMTAYLLGSALFTRHAFLKTSLTLIASGIIFSIVLIVVAFKAPHSFTTVMLTAVAAMAVAAVLNVIGAWKIYKITDCVPHTRII